VDCVAVVDQVIALLRQRARLTYCTLQLQFQPDEAHLEALKEEIIYGQRLAVDEAGVEDVPQLCQVRKGPWQSCSVASRQTGRWSPGFFSLQQTGISPKPIKDAADAFIASLTAAQQKVAPHPIDSQEWRKWTNWGPYPLRHGVSLDQMSRIPARCGTRAAQGEPERAGVRDGAPRHEAQRSAGGNHRQLRVVWGMVLRSLHLWHALYGRTMGLADGWPPP
jgi:hypothetical protein